MRLFLRRLAIGAAVAIGVLIPLAYADTLTTNLLLTKQTVGGNTNTWGTVLNANFEAIDDKLGTVTTINTTGGTTTLSSSEEIAQVIKVTGTLVSNATLQFSGRGGFWIIDNQTTGDFTLTAKLSGQTGTTIATGNKKTVYSDATDIKEAISSPPSEIPVGTIVNYGGTTAPDDWLLCYGQAISRTTYADLFAVIGTTYGTGDGITTFNAPDMRGRVVVNQDDMGGSSANRVTDAEADSLNGDTLGDTGGVETQTLSEAEMPAHTHTGPSHTHTGPAHTHTFSDPSSTTSTNGDHSHSENNAFNAGQAIEPGGNQANGGEEDDGQDTDSAGDHTHTVAVSGTTSSDGTGATGASGTGATSSTGSSEAVSVMPPAIVLNALIYAGV